MANSRYFLIVTSGALLELYAVTDLSQNESNHIIVLYGYFEGDKSHGLRDGAFSDVTPYSDETISQSKRIPLARAYYGSSRG